MQGLFSHVADCADDNVTCRIDISYYEIYNERVRDLLQPELLKQNEKYSLKVREHPKEGPYVKGINQGILFYTNFRKNVKNLNTRKKTTISNLKFEQLVLQKCNALRLKGADRMANNVDLLRSSLIWVYAVCQDPSVLNVRIITVAYL